MRTILMCLSMAMLVQVAAEDSAPPPVDSAEVEVGQAEADTEQTAVKKDKTEFETPESFRATEQLSEDVAAPFPVDI